MTRGGADAIEKYISTAMRRAMVYRHRERRGSFPPCRSRRPSALPRAEHFHHDPGALQRPRDRRRLGPRPRRHRPAGRKVTGGTAFRLSAACSRQARSGQPRPSRNYDAGRRPGWRDDLGYEGGLEGNHLPRHRALTIGSTTQHRRRLHDRRAGQGPPRRRATLARRRRSGSHGLHRRASGAGGARPRSGRAGTWSSASSAAPRAFSGDGADQAARGPGEACGIRIMPISTLVIGTPIVGGIPTRRWARERRHVCAAGAGTARAGAPISSGRLADLRQRRGRGGPYRPADGAGRRAAVRRQAAAR